MKISAEHHSSPPKQALKLSQQLESSIAGYTMLEEGDKVMACLSDGKDSYGLLDILTTLRAVRRYGSNS